MGWLGPVVGDVQHEGWVVPLFADGAEGAGTSSSRGILVARQPGDGPRNGDRVQLTYPDDSRVVGLWQDDALVLEDGVVYSHVRGQVRREVLEEAEEWRPDAAVVGYVAGCECGWRGRPWTRVHSATAAGSTAWHGPEDDAVVDEDNRLIFQPGPYYDLDGAAEQPVIEEWRRHIAPWRSLEDLEEAAARQAAATRELDEAVRAAKAAGASWADIGRATGMTRQSANERWSSRV
ncbi:MAG: hypothetical protein DI571_02350 [Arsenicicoccus sp.]|nr:MAG: hypothetical protein DI571_02350 [Arsenicicoccus sp.]